MNESNIPLFIPVSAGLSVLALVLNFLLGFNPGLILISTAGAFCYLLFVKLKSISGKKTDYALSSDFACGVSAILIASTFFHLSAPLAIGLLIFFNMLFNIVCDRIFSKETLSDLTFCIILNIIFVITFIFFWNGNTAILSGFINSADFATSKIITVYVLLALLFALYYLLKPEIMLLPQGKTFFAASGMPYLASVIIMYFTQAVVFTILISCAGILVLPAFAVLCGSLRDFKIAAVFPALLYAQISVFVLSKTQHPAVFTIAFMLHFAVIFALKLKERYTI